MDEWGMGSTAVGRRVFLNGSDYYQPLLGPDLSEDARSLDISACYNRKLLRRDASFSFALAEIFYSYALETDRPWGLRQPWAVRIRGSDEVPASEQLISELLRSGYWLDDGVRLRLCDAGKLTEYWRWFDAEQRRRATVRRIDSRQRERILDRDGRRCLLCGSTSSLVIDHISPVAEGGGKDDGNLRTLCRNCNAARNFPHPPRTIYNRA
jgi:hypothetical protein